MQTYLNSTHSINRIHSLDILNTVAENRSNFFRIFKKNSVSANLYDQITYLK